MSLKISIPLSPTEARDLIIEFIARQREANATNAAPGAMHRAAESRLWLASLLMGREIVVGTYAIRKWPTRQRRKGKVVPDEFPELEVDNERSEGA